MSRIGSIQQSARVFVLCKSASAVELFHRGLQKRIRSRQSKCSSKDRIQVPRNHRLVTIQFRRDTMIFSLPLALALVSPVVSRFLGQNKIASRPALDRHIVKLRSVVTASAADSIKASWTNALSHEYSMHGFEAFAGTFTSEELARLQASDYVRIFF